MSATAELINYNEIFNLHLHVSMIIDNDGKVRFKLPRSRRQDCVGQQH